jgi:hypothetical protein
MRLADGAITTFDVSSAGTGFGQGTLPQGENDADTITGNFIDASGVSHGFVRSPSGSITTFDAGTGSGQTFPYTINLLGAIVGYELDRDLVAHGFLRTP